MIRLIVLFNILISVSWVAVGNDCQVNIIMLGDSITQGLIRDANGNQSGIINYGNGLEIDDFSQSPVSYGTTIKALVRSVGCDEVFAYNWGYHGYDSGVFPSLVPQTLSKLNSLKSSNSLNFAFIMMGANDAYDGESSNHVVSNIQSVVNQYKAAGVTPILSTVTRNTSTVLLRNIVSSYNQKIISYAANNSVALVDNYHALDPWSSHNSGDNLHVNEAGYVLMGNAWFSLVEEMILAAFPQSLFLPAIFLLLDD